MAGVLQRTLALLELLSREARGLPLAAISAKLDLPKSAAHRLLAELIAAGYVVQPHDQGPYLLTTKLAGIGLAFLSSTGIVDIAQPVLDRFAELSGELVRLAILDGDRLAWIARAQGARNGLRYDAEMGADARLSCSASGHAMLMTMSNQQALERVAAQGFGMKKDFGPNAPESPGALMRMLGAARKRGFAVTDETFAAGLATIAAPICEDGELIGTLSISGPNVRFTVEKMNTLSDHLLAAADELAIISTASPMMRVRRSGL